MKMVEFQKLGDGRVIARAFELVAGVAFELFEGVPIGFFFKHDGTS